MNKKALSVDYLERFVDRLIHEKHGQSLPRRRHTQHRSDLVNELHGTLHRKLLARLHRQEAAEVKQLLHRGKPNHEIQRFILERIPDAAVYLTHVLLHFRISYLSQPHQNIGSSQ